MKQKKLGFRTLLAALVLAVLPGVCAAQSTENARTAGAEMVEEVLSARVLQLMEGETRVLINKGRAEGVTPGSECIIRPNRGETSAQIEWDIYYAKGTVQEVGERTSVVSITDLKAPVQEGDYCQVPGRIPAFITGTDIGRIALFDIVFTGYREGRPIYELADLVRAPRRETVDQVIDLMLQELHANAEVMQSWSEGRKVQGGLFHGMSWGDALRATDREQLRRFLEYVSWYPASYINFDWLFIDSYTGWVISGTSSGEPEKRRQAASPVADQGDRLVLEGEYQEAVRAYKRALDIHPEYQRARDRLDLVASMLNHRKMLEQDPKDVTVRYRLGVEYYDLGRHEDALQQLRRARELGYDPIEADAYMGYTLASLGRYAEAREIFEKLTGLRPDDEHKKKWLRWTRALEREQEQGASVETALAKGDIKYDEQSYDQAITEYRRGMEREPGSRVLWERILRTTRRRLAFQYQQWARSYWSDGQFDAARDYWGRALDMCDDIEDRAGARDTLDEMADRLYDSKLYDEAIQTYRRAIQYDPGHYDGYISISNCYENKGDYGEAIAWARRGIEINPGDAWGHNVLGYIYLKTGELRKAVGPLSTSVELDRAYKYPSYNLGTVYTLLGDYQEAAKNFRRALEIDQDYGKARSRLVDIQVVLETTAVLRNEPGDTDARVRLARALFNLEDYTQAGEQLELALAASPRNAEALKYRGYTFARLGDYRKALEYLRKTHDERPGADLGSWMRYVKAQAMLEQDPDDPAAYLELAEDNVHWENYDSALSQYETAQRLGADPDRVMDRMERARAGKLARSHYDLSLEYYQRGDFQKALEYAQAALDRYLDAGIPRGAYHATLQSGACHAGMFRHHQARERYEQAGEQARGLGDQGLQASYFSFMGDYHQKIGEYEAALDFFRKAGELYHRNNQLVMEARNALYLMGGVLRQTGEHERALEYYGRALDIHRAAMNPEGTALVLDEMGWVYSYEGDYSTALDYKMESLQVARRHDQRWAELSALHGIGDVYYDLGDAENALAFYNQYIDLAVALASKSDRSIGINSLGLVYLELEKDYDKALAAFQEALDLAELVGYTLMQGVALANIGVTHSRQGRYLEALRYHDRGLALVREMNNEYTEMQGLHEKGETYYLMEEYEQALIYLLRADELAEKLRVDAERWKYQLAAGKACQARGDTTSAVEYYTSAARTLAGIKSKIRSEKLRKGYGEQERQLEVYRRLIDLLIQEGRPEEALRYIEESKSKIIRDAFGEIAPETDDQDLNETLGQVDRYEKKKEALEKQLQEEMKKPEQQQDRTKLETLSRTLATTQKEFNQWMLKLQFQNRTMYESLTINPTTLADIQEDIPSDTLILEYFISSDELYVFCIGRNYFFVKSVEVRGEEIVRLVTSYLRRSRKPTPRGLALLERDAAQLYDYLVRPVEEAMERFRNVVIAPFGVLYYLPFHALLRKEGEASEYLIERARISYTTSATIMDLLKEDRRSLESMLALGNPDGSLPGASEEVERLKNEIFRNRALVWTLSDASKENFFSQAHNYDILHIATHGLIEKNPLDSYLLLAGSTPEQQRLTLLDVAGYTALKQNTQLVFLSACRTATESAGDHGTELITLAQAFAIAGPPTLIATLWEVADRSTSLLVYRFYRELTGGETNTLDALRAAQLSLLKSEQYHNPFYWAPFVMIGSWR